MRVTIESPARGTAPQVPITLYPQTCSATWSWGLQPAVALIDWVSMQAVGAIVPMAQMKIEFRDNSLGPLAPARQTFYGLANEQTPVKGSDGISLMMRFADSREFLMWDTVKCRFNRRYNRIENGVLKKYYEHILPADWPGFRKTYTVAPYTALDIIEFLFLAPGVHTGWTLFLHENMFNPVYDIDCESGQLLGTVVQEISEKVGLVFTLLGGRYDLVWTVKGVGALPDFPANSDHRRGPGLCLSGHPTGIEVIGDRSLYQILNVTMEPDWQAAYEPLVDSSQLIHFVFENLSTETAIGGIAADTDYNAIPGDTGNLIGLQLAKARAWTLTVGDLADFFGAAYADYRKFNGKSRLSMPVELYCRQLVYRAYKPPDNFSILNIAGRRLDLFSLELQDGALVEVSHDPASGAMDWDLDVVTATNGYCIAQGYQVGQNAFQVLHPERFNVASWVSAQSIWSRISFAIDDSGQGSQFIILEKPAILSADLIKLPSISGVTQDYPVLNFAPTITAAPVRAALVFAAERFSFFGGLPAKNQVENVGGLNAQFVGSQGGGGLAELPYADGQTASFKANALVQPLLSRQFYYQTGGYEVQGSNGTQLTPVIDRVSITLSGSGGLTEEVDFTNERNTNADANGNVMLEPDRNYERRQQLQPLLPGQRELKVAAAAARADAIALRADPRLAKLMRDTFDDLYGYDAEVFQTYLNNPTGQTIPAGCPLWRYPSDINPENPGPAVSIATPVFVGITTRDGQPDHTLITCTQSGVNGVALVRVKGPLALNDPVGYDQANGTADMFLVAKPPNPTSGSPTPIVGTAQDVIAGTSTKLVRVRLSAAAATGAVTYRGLYDATISYNRGDIIRMQSGTSQGIWICVVDGLLAGTEPLFPEPVSTGGTNNWDMITFGINVTVGCTAGVTGTFYINAR